MLDLDHKPSLAQATIPGLPPTERPHPEQDLALPLCACLHPSSWMSATDPQIVPLGTQPSFSGVSRVKQIAAPLPR